MGELDREGGAPRLFGRARPVLGMIHLAPLPGAPGYGGSMADVVGRALADARACLTGGLDGLIVENYGDVPFHAGALPPETVAALTLAAARIRDLGSFPLGINALRSDGHAALAIAAAVGAQFIRVNVFAGAMVTDQGILQGCAATVARARRSWGGPIAVWADLLVKHAAPLAPVDPETAAADLVERSLADALIITGPRTGTPIDPEVARAARRAAPRTPLVLGSGVQTETLEALWPLADGFIVGTALKVGGVTAAPIDPRRAAALMTEHGRLLALHGAGRAPASPEHDSGSEERT